MATLTMWKIFMAPLLAAALVMPVTLAHQHSMSGGVGQDGPGHGGALGMGMGMGSSGGSGLGKDAHGKFAFCFLFSDYFKWPSKAAPPQAAQGRPINKFKYLTNSKLCRNFSTSSRVTVLHLLLKGQRAAWRVQLVAGAARGRVFYDFISFRLVLHFALSLSGVTKQAVALCLSLFFFLPTHCYSSTSQLYFYCCLTRH